MRFTVSPASLTVYIPILTPYRPTDKTCQIFSFPLEGNMLYRHLHQKVFWTGVFYVLTLTRSLHLWQPRFLTSASFATVIFSDFSKLNKLLINLESTHSRGGNSSLHYQVTLIILTHRELSTGLVAQIPRDGFEPSTCRI